MGLWTRAAAGDLTLADDVATQQQFSAPDMPLRNRSSPSFRAHWRSQRSLAWWLTPPQGPAALALIMLSVGRSQRGGELD